MSEKCEETVDGRIETLEALLGRTMGRKVLQQRIDGVEIENKGLKRSLARERAWSSLLEGRVEELEHVVGVVRDLAEDLHGRCPAGFDLAQSAEMIVNRLSEVIDDRDDGGFCPTCSKKRD